MAFVLDIRAEGLNERIRSIAGISKRADRAVRRSLNRTVVSVRREVAREIAQRANVPQRVLLDQGRGQRVYARFSPRKGQLEGAVWVGYRNIKAAYVGKLQQLKRGARAGKSHFFEGGFIATMKSGHTGIFKRDPNATRRAADNVFGITSLPIIEQEVELKNAESAIRIVQVRAERKLARELLAQLNFEINVKR